MQNKPAQPEAQKQAPVNLSDSSLNAMFQLSYCLAVVQSNINWKGETAELFYLQNGECAQGVIEFGGGNVGTNVSADTVNMGLRDTVLKLHPDAFVCFVPLSVGVLAVSQFWGGQSKISHQLINGKIANTFPGRDVGGIKRIIWNERLKPYYLPEFSEVSVCDLTASSPLVVLTTIF